MDVNKEKANIPNFFNDKYKNLDKANNNYVNINNNIFNNNMININDINHNKNLLSNNFIDNNGKYYLFKVQNQLDLNKFLLSKNQIPRNISNNNISPLNYGGVNNIINTYNFLCLYCVML